MESVYFWCAVVGGTTLAIQTLLLLVGFGVESVDLDSVGDLPDSDLGHGDVFFKFLTVQTFVAFFTFFGLTGLLLVERDTASPLREIIAGGVGLGAFTLVGYLMALLQRLQSDGNLILKKAIGTSAQVYLRIPPAHTGQGKVTVVLHGRSMQYKAITAGPEIPTGHEVQIVGVPSANTVEVIATKEV